MANQHIALQQRDYGLAAHLDGPLPIAAVALATVHFELDGRHPAFAPLLAATPSRSRVADQHPDAAALAARAELAQVQLAYDRVAVHLDVLWARCVAGGFSAGRLDSAI